MFGALWLLDAFSRVQFDSPPDKLDNVPWLMSTVAQVELGRFLRDALPEHARHWNREDPWEPRTLLIIDDRQPVSATGELDAALDDLMSSTRRRVRLPWCRVFSALQSARRSDAIDRPEPLRRGR